METKKDIKELKKLLKDCLKPKQSCMPTSTTSAIIAKTHDIQGSNPIWWLAQQQSINDCAFSAWKFCLLMHKILRNGHRQVLADGWANLSVLQNLTHNWQSQRMDLSMGLAIAWYCQVLKRKLHFHAMQKHMLGNLEAECMPTMELDRGFQFALDVMDYLEDLLQLQCVILHNVTNNHMLDSSKATACHLAPLGIVIEECQMLYDHLIQTFCIFISQLPADVIGDVNGRFARIHCGMQQSYEFLRSQPKLLIPATIPTLSTTPPNWQAMAASHDICHLPSAPLAIDMDE